ncbi:MAG: rhamnan synthesis F family protein [Eubacteriales bacterium]
MNRCAIVVFYDQEGVVDQSVHTLISELQKVSTHVICVVNGFIREQDLQYLESTVDEMILRDNNGLDGGAYQDVICNHIGMNQLREYDEVLLCNTTFFGFFQPLELIFEKMSNDTCDFWGIDYCERTPFFAHIGSYFMVFRKSTVISGELHGFFEQMKEIHDHRDASIEYELGIYRYFTEHGYHSGAYLGELKYNFYQCPHYALTELGYPVLKKRIFCERYYNKDRAYRALQIIGQYEHDYLTEILDSINRIYGKHLEREEVLSYHIQDEESGIEIGNHANTTITAESLEAYSKGIKELYVYGVGSYGIAVMYSHALQECCKRNQVSIRGFLVSDGHRVEEYYQEYPIYELEEIVSSQDVGIIVGMDQEHTNEVRQRLNQNDNVLYMWDT